MSPLNELRSADVSKAIVTFDALLRAQKDVINRLNVYPVPDGDTGTNMSLTMQSVAAGLASLAEDASLGEVGKTIAHASLLGARGNSGVILSQMLRGFTECFSGVDQIGLDEFRTGLSIANERARQAVSRPVEGTILSVAQAAAEATASSTSLAEAVRAARDGAVVALAHTPEQLPVLKQAGVVDSGGTGLVLWFDALCHVVAGDALPITPALPEVHLATTSAPLEPTDISALRYEVMFILEGNDDAMGVFRSTWESLGDSIVIVGGDGLYNCHIHTDHVGPSIEAALEVGRPRDIRVTDLLEQAGEEGWVLGAALPTSPAPATAVVAVAAGTGLVTLFTSLGVRQVVVGGQTMNPSTAELAAAVTATGSANVIILPNNKNIRAVAEQVNAVVALDVRVIATNSVQEGLSAMVGYVADLGLEQNLLAMTAAAEAVTAGELTQAVRDTTSDVGAVLVGDWIGLGAGGIVSVSASIAEAAQQLVAALRTDEHELMTIVEGDGASPEVTAVLREAADGLDVQVLAGGQPLYPYLIGLE